MSDSETTDTYAESTDQHVYEDQEYHYEDVQVRQFKEKRSHGGSISQLRLTLSATLVEPTDEEIYEVGTDEFELIASGINLEGENVRLSKFKPLRDEEFRGLYVHEFEVLWEALEDIEKRGYNIDTGTLARAEGE